jgi:hypothetical protein
MEFSVRKIRVGLSEIESSAAMMIHWLMVFIDPN